MLLMHVVVVRSYGVRPGCKAQHHMIHDLHPAIVQLVALAKVASGFLQRLCAEQYIIAVWGEF